MMHYPIHHTFGPMADAQQRRAASALLVQPWRWKHGRDHEAFRKALEKHFDASVHLFSTGREALLAFLKAAEICEGHEVIVQGYTCVVVPNAIIAAGATPVFVDIEKDSLSLDPDAVERAITSKTKVIICQHTFGIPAPLQALRTIADRHKLLLIEDCAHVLPENIIIGEIGGTGDAVLLSFGRDKAISGVSGGAIVARNGWHADVLRHLEEGAEDLSLLAIKRFLLYPLLYGFCRPLYGSVGRVLLKLFAVLRLLPPIVTEDEKGGRQGTSLHRMPNACARLALVQLRRLTAINDHRRALTRFYLAESARRGWPVLHGISSDLPLQKYPLFMEGAEAIRRSLKKRNIHLQDGWTGCVVCPPSADPMAAGYRGGTDPQAERCAEQILALPTHPGMTMEQAEYCTGELSRALHDRR